MANQHDTDFFTVLLIILSTYLYQLKVSGWDRPTSYFASIPGALTFVFGLAGDYPRADLSRVAISQSFRVFMLISILPTVLGGSLNHDDVLQESSSSITGSAKIMMLIFLSALFRWGAMKMKIPAGWLTGAFILSSFLNASG